MHKGETRRDRNRMNELLRPGLVEFGRSGTRYSRADILEELSSESAFPAIHSEDFQVAELAEGVELLTYVSAHLDAQGNAHRHRTHSGTTGKSAGRLRKSAKEEPLPKLSENVDTIAAQHRIDCRNRNAFGARLCNQHAIEGVSMQRRK